MAVSLVRSGGLLITDNVLWGGKVADDGAHDASTEAIRAFNKALFARGDLESMIVPVGDGVSVCRKK